MYHFYFMIIISCSGFLACIQESNGPAEQSSRRPVQGTTGSGSGTETGTQPGAGTGSSTFPFPSASAGGDGLGTETGDDSGTGTESGENGGLPIPDGDPTQVIYLSGSIGSYFSPVQNDPEGEVDFICPGDSFLSGENSKWDFDTGSQDRTHRFRCRFLTDGQGVPIRKSNCSVSDPINDATLDYSCSDGKFLSGVTSTFNQQTKDRSYEFECCEARSQQENTLLTPNKEILEEGGDAIEMCHNAETSVIRPDPSNPDPSLVNVEVNSVLSEADFNCSGAALQPFGGGLVIDYTTVPLEHAILKRVRSSLKLDNQDRRYSFYCCQLQVGSSADDEEDEL